jgi:beta-1,4-mannosyl-glycoprotein beta-1,4-N-acetylglucosaminyltransferase
MEFVMHRVISCSQFFNELDLLQIKMHTLDPIVDYFVISESTKTHSGLDKPLYFEENKDRFKEFEHKIIHQIITDTPSDYTNLEYNNDLDHDHIVDKINNQTHWNKNVESYGRDSWEKESLIIPIFQIPNLDYQNDIVLLSDLDEIVRPSALKKAIDNYIPFQVYHFQHQMFYYYLNIEKNEEWYGTLMTSFGNFYHNSFCEMRTNKKGIFIDNGGWHFTYQGGLDKIRQKIHSWGEQSLNTDIVNNNLENNFENFIALERDLFFRQSKFIIRDINDGTFPEYIVENKDKFSDYIYKGT